MKSPSGPAIRADGVCLARQFVNSSNDVLGGRHIAKATLGWLGDIYVPKRAAIQLGRSRRRGLADEAAMRMERGIGRAITTRAEARA